MNNIYTRKTRTFLIISFWLTAVALLAVSFRIWSLLFLFGDVTETVIFFVLLILLPSVGIITISLQNRRHINYGYLIFAPLVASLYVWTWGLFQVSDAILKEHSETPLIVSIFVVGLVFLLPYFYVASSLLSYTSQRKFLTTLSIAALLIAISLIIISYQNSVATLPQNWKTYTEENCGYRINYSPKLSVGGGGQKLSCKRMKFDMSPGSNSDFVEISPTNLNLAHSPTSKAYTIELDAQYNWVSFQCVYSSEEMLAICNEMQDSFQPTGDIIRL